MADVLRIVTFDYGGRKTEVLNLNSAPGTVTAYFRERNSFQFTPAASNVQFASRARRYGGGRAIGETHENASIAWTAYVRGATLLAATQNVEALLENISSEARGRFIEWAPEGGKSSYMEIAGPGSWVPAYNPVEFVQTNAMRVQLTFPVLPLVCWDPCSIRDNFDYNSEADYTFDVGTAADIDISGTGYAFATGAATTQERRLRHTARGYSSFREGYSTLGFRTGTTITSCKYGVILRGMAADSAIEVYVDDNGTNSRLRIDVLTAGTRVNRSSVNLAARMTTTTNYTIRGRIENSAVFAEHFTIGVGTSTSILATPANSTSYTLSGTEITDFDPGGYAGITWIPQGTLAELHYWDYVPFLLKGSTGRAVPYTSAIFMIDPIPGNAPALVDVSTTVSGASTAPAFALIGWTAQPLDGGGAPFGVYLTSTTTSLGNLTSSADANSLTNSAAKDTTVSGAETYSMTWAIDPGTLPPDAFGANEIDIEVWLRASISSTVVSPTVTVSARQLVGAQYGATRYTNEWGSTGKVLTPAAGTFYSMYRLGIITLPCDPTNRPILHFIIGMTTAAGSTGSVAFDYALLVPARSRCLSPSGKELDSAYPLFISSTSVTTKTIKSDLSGVAREPGSLTSFPDHGLGGSLIEVAPGVTYWLIKLSDQVPDDPTPAAAHESLSYNTAVSLDVVPRSFFLRDV